MCAHIAAGSSFIDDVLEYFLQARQDAKGSHAA
jgi:hypothetical protein